MQDYHMHCSHSTDSEQTLDAICAKAIAMNLSEIAVTDHIDIDYPYDIAFLFDIKARNAAIDVAQKKFPQLAIKKGVEIGITPETKSDYVNMVNAHDFDFVIASIHVVNGVDPFYSEYFESRTKEDAYLRYLEAIYDGMQGFDDYDVLGHIGYASRFYDGEDKVMRYADYADILDKILKKLIETDKGLEVNTKGISATGDTLPSESILQRYFELGGKRITLGSDAHIPARIGEHIEATGKRLKQIGFTHYTSYTKRKPKQMEL